MSMFDLNEPTIAALQARLREELPGAIDAINAESEDGYFLAHVPSEQVLDYVPAASELVAFPTVGIMDGTINLADDVGWGATAVFDLSVLVFCQSADQRDLALQLRRYARAIANVALRGRQLDPAWGVVLDSISPGPTLGRSEGPREWMSFRAVNLTLRAEADTP